MRSPSKVDTGNPGEYTIKRIVKYEIKAPDSKKKNSDTEAQ